MPNAVGATGSHPLATDSGLDPALLEPPDQMGKDMFLKLMVAQLKYQNPLEPMDSSQFMAQTAQFTTVEKLTELTDKLTESLVNDRLSNATAMIGRSVTYMRPDGVTATEMVTGVKFQATGPMLVLADGSEVGMGDVESVAMPTAPAPTPETPTA